MCDLKQSGTNAPVKLALLADRQAELAFLLPLSRHEALSAVRSQQPK
jgi:hypothetical protein